MKEIPLTGKYGKGKFALIDDEDFERVKQHLWYLDKSNGSFRPATWIKRKNVFLYWFIMGVKNVDHKNGNTLDSTRTNLRICTQSQNGANRKKQRTFRGKPTSSSYKGVSRNGSKWEASIQVNRKSIYLGRFNDEIDAAQTYNEAAQFYFGEFAKLNEFESAA